LAVFLGFSGITFRPVGVEKGPFVRSLSSLYQDRGRGGSPNGLENGWVARPVPPSAHTGTVVVPALAKGAEQLIRQHRAGVPNRHGILEARCRTNGHPAARAGGCAKEPHEDRDRLPRDGSGHGLGA
jgi:hypothetical protein